jgi:zinc D-Ala-D-Ala carboxypeptidase
MNLTRNFTLAEMCKSQTALNRGWDNIAKGEYVENLRALCENVLQPLRDNFNLPVKVHSAYRSPNVNRAVGGRFNSQHLVGEAADIEIDGVSNADVWRYIVSELPYDQCIAEYLEKNDPSAGWVHVSYSRANNRKEAFSYTKTGSKPVAGLMYGK